MLPKAYGTFKRRGDYIFRTEARLQWGNSNESLGLIIMLNPGSSKLANPKQWRRFLASNEDCEEMDQELDLDETMKAIAEILEQSHPDLHGYLEIRNLFNLRTEQSRAKVAIDEYQKVMGQRVYEDLLHCTFDDLGKFPWVWLGWTVETSPFLKRRKLHVLKRVIDMKKFVICKEPPPNNIDYKEYYCYHPFPIVKKQVQEYRTAMVEQMINHWIQMRR